MRGSAHMGFCDPVLWAVQPVKGGRSDCAGRFGLRSRGFWRSTQQRSAPLRGVPIHRPTTALDVAAARLVADTEWTQDVDRRREPERTHETGKPTYDAIRATDRSVPQPRQ